MGWSDGDKHVVSGEVYDVGVTLEVVARSVFFECVGSTEGLYQSTPSLVPRMSDADEVF